MVGITVNILDIFVLLVFLGCAENATKRSIYGSAAFCQPSGITIKGIDLTGVCVIHPHQGLVVTERNILRRD